MYLSGIPLKAVVAAAMYESFFEANLNSSSSPQQLSSSLNSGINKAASAIDMLHINGNNGIICIIIFRRTIDYW